MADVEATRARVQAILTAGGPVQIDQRGVLSVPAGSTRVFVDVLEHGNKEVSVVQVRAIVAWEVPATPELFEYVAKEGSNYFFGHLHVWDDPDVPGTVSMSMTHTLLGDFLDKEELMYAVYGIAGSADELDDTIVSRFGGRLFQP